MLDIVKIEDGEDLTIEDSETMKAANVLSVPLDSLEYAPDFGIDFAYFFDSDIQYPNDSFKAYLIQRLVESQVNVSDVDEVIEALYSKLIFKVGPTQKAGGLGL